jgi:hypothetical protein
LPRRARPRRTASGDGSGLRPPPLAWPGHARSPARAHARLPAGSAGARRPLASPGARRLPLCSPPAPPLPPWATPKSLPPHRLVHPRMVWRRGATRILNSFGQALAGCPPGFSFPSSGQGTPAPTQTSDTLRARGHNEIGCQAQSIGPNERIRKWATLLQQGQATEFLVRLNRCEPTERIDGLRLIDNGLVKFDCFENGMEHQAAPVFGSAEDNRDLYPGWAYLLHPIGNRLPFSSFGEGSAPTRPTYGFEVACVPHGIDTICEWSCHCQRRPEVAV